LVVWADRVEQISPFASKLETDLVEYLWADEKDPHVLVTPNSSPLSKHSATVASPPRQTSSVFSESGLGEANEVDEDPVATQIKQMRKERPLPFHAAFIAGCASAFAMVLLGLGIREYS
jgi:hypothetical protein